MTKTGPLHRSARLLLFSCLIAATLYQPGSGAAVNGVVMLEANATVRMAGLRSPVRGVTLVSQGQAGSYRVGLAGKGSVKASSVPLAGDAAAQYTSAPATARPIAPGLLASPAAAPLVRATDLVFQGAFRLPVGEVGGSSFAYGGTAMTFNSARGSLFMVGHDWQQQVAEVSVPEIRRGTSPSDLAMATVLQPFTDATEGKMSAVGTNTVKIGGLLAYRGQLYLSAYLYYDGNGAQTLSHFVSGLDLKVKGDVRGPYRLSTGAGLVAGYFGLIPAEWQGELGGPVLNGQCCIPIINRSSFGPAAFAIDPARLGTADPLPAAPLVYYTQAHQLGNYGGDSELFNGTTQMGGVVFPEGTRSVLFFGSQGLGPYCYGEAADCHDPGITSKGPHAYPYAYYVWAYDAADLATVKSGRKRPWDVKPYAVWTLDLSFASPNARIAGVAYDAKTRRIFVSQYQADGDNPLIDVFVVR